MQRKMQHCRYQLKLEARSVSICSKFFIQGTFFVNTVHINEVYRQCFPPIGGFPPILPEFLTPLRSVQIWGISGPIYRGG